MRELADKFEAIAWWARAIKFVGYDPKYVRYCEAKAEWLYNGRKAVIGSVF